MMSFLSHYTTIIFTTIIFLLASTAHGQTTISCSEIQKIIPLGKTKASASFFSNLFKSEGSMNYESERAFQITKTRILQDGKPTDLCKNPCQLSSTPIISFKSIPTAFQSEYKEYHYCNKKEQETLLSPLIFSKSGFKTLDVLSRWIETFSQGKGSEGEELYKICDASCSPQYQYFISENKESYSVVAEIVCGHARDKSDNSYNLTYSYSWSCY
jgi:hypothetical protein